MSREHIQKQYDLHGRAYQTKRDDPIAGIWNRHLDFPILVELVGERVENADLLDVGCGDGRLLHALAPQTRSRQGLDLSTTMIELARERYPDNRFHVADICDTKMEASRFDIIVSSLVLHYLEQLAPAFNEIARILRPNGYFVFSMHHPLNEILEFPEAPSVAAPHARDYFEEFQYKWRMLDGMELVSYHHTFESISRAADDAGFVIEAIREPRATPAHEGASEEYLRRCSRFPPFCAFRARLNR